jgi:nucleotide-binding universal stress UspA family protein
MRPVTQRLDADPAGSPDYRGEVEMFKNVLVPLPSWPERLSDEALGSAVAVARTLGADVTTLGFDLVVHAPSNVLANAFLDIPGMVAEVRKQSDANEREMETAMAAAAKATGVRLTGRTARCLSSEIFDRAAEQARVHDLTVVAWGGAEADRIYLAETVVFESGRPILVLPPPSAVPSAFRRVVVAWDGGPQAARALADALPLLRSAEDVRILTIHGEKPLSQTDLLADLGRHLDIHGVTATLDRVDAGGRRIGEVFADYTRQHGSDLLVMGAFGHSRWREIVLGGATQSMLAVPPVPVLLSH